MMYRVMIVEDNSIYRYAIRTIINWEEHGFELAAEAVNGKQALEKLNQSHVDLLITDISMPEMNGIELIQTLREKYPRVKTIVLSSFDDFHFVKEALKLGAVDYLLKHDLEEEALIKVLLQVREIMVKEREQEIARTDSGTKRIQRLLLSACRGQATDEELDQRAEALNLPFRRSPIVVLVLALHEVGLSEEEDELLQSVQKQWEQASIILPVHPYRLAILLDFGREKSEAFIASLVYESINRLTGESRIRNYSFSIGVSQVGWGVKELHHLYVKADIALFQKMYSKEDTVTVFLQQPEISRHAHIEIIQQLKSSIKIGSVQAMEQAVDQLFAEINQTKPGPGTLSKILLDLFAFLVVQASERNVSMEDMSYWHIYMSNALNLLEPISLIKQTLVERCYSLFNDRTNAAISERREISKAMAFIQEHIHEDFTVKDVSLVLNLSPNYLSNLFKQQTGKRMVEYIQECRVEAAKKLLQESLLKVYEVAEKVGFNDTSYFCKVFKAYTGTTVSEFKKQVL